MSEEFKYSRDFKGVWIPKEIYLDNDLDAIEKILFSEISSLDKEENEGCYASNEYLASFCGCSKSKISSGISKLIKKGYIYVSKFDGRKRWLRVGNGEESLSKSDKKIDELQNKDGSLPEKRRQKSFFCNPALHKNDEINNSINNTANNTFNNTDIHAFNPSEKSEGLKEIHASCYHTKPVSAPKKKRVGYLKPGEFTADDLYKHLYQRSLRYCLHNGKDEYDARDFARVIHYFYMAYKNKMGHDHPFLNDGAFERVADAYFHPPEYIFDGDLTSVDNYAMMIDRFLETNFGERKKNEYGYGNEIETDPTISLFMSSEFREHIAMHLFEEP